MFLLNKAFVVVDMTHDFIADDGALTCGDAGQRIVPPILDRLQERLSAGDLIIFACDAHQPEDPEFRLWPPHCVVGTPEAALYGPLQDFYIRHRGDQVRFLAKTRYDAFFATDLDQWLKDSGVTEVFIAGVCTSICCYATASGAYYRNYRVQVDPQTMADLTIENHLFAVTHMQQVLKAQVIS